MTIYADKPWLKHYDPGVPETLAPYPETTLHDLLRQSAQKYPNRTALVTDAKLPVLGHQNQL